MNFELEIEKIHSIIKHQDDRFNQT